MDKRISVRNLVEFILRSGSIDSGFSGANRLEEGSRVHRKLQKEGGDNYLTEVHLSATEECRGVTFTVEGRADGVIVSDSGVTIDEIKSTLTPLDQIDEDFSQIHWAQAMCYGHIYCAKNALREITVRLTYYEMESGGIKRFSRSFTAEKLQEFFTELLEKYSVWALFERDWHETAGASMRALAFPFDTYRDGQRRLAAAVYRTIEARGRLFAMAPTGVGKTISTLFPAVKAMGEGLCEKIFYLTAKTITRQAAQDALRIMRGRGLRAKSVTLTAKDKICFLEERVCKPEYCKYADGHFDRVGDAVLDVLRNCDSITAEVISDYAERHRVCPFELGLDLTLWSDIIICDYNYLFDPQVYLKRFFTDGGEFVYLIDEAHNLAGRAREMYSAQISKRELLAVRKAVGKQDAKLRAALGKVNKHLLERRRECESADSSPRTVKEADSELNVLLEVFCFEFSRWLGENPDPEQELLEAFFNVLSYLKIAEYYDDNFFTVSEPGPGGEFTVRQLCADPSRLLAARYETGRAAALFSATLTPPDYYAAVLGGGEDCKYLAVPSPFPRGNLLLLVADGISTKYKDRDSSIDAVAEMIYAASSWKTGNYIAYFPSYGYLDAVYTRFCEMYPGVNTLVQESGMAELAREEFLLRFEADTRETMVAFCVLGGVFSEGIDLVGERLVGTVIVGVGLPQLNTELDIVRGHYGARGYDFAYRFPGMNKVLQAAGRVIRGETDRGLVLLIDDRFATRQYTRLFPEHWRGFKTVRGAAALAAALADFGP